MLFSLGVKIISLLSPNQFISRRPKLVSLSSYMFRFRLLGSKQVLDFKSKLRHEDPEARTRNFFNMHLIKTMHVAGYLTSKLVQVVTIISAGY